MDAPHPPLNAQADASQHPLDAAAIDTSGRGSVTHWIAQLRAGGTMAEAHAQQELWDRYFRRIVGLAKTKLGSLPKGSADEEDVAISAMQSLFHGFAADRFPRLEDRNNLWSLLAKMTARKAINQRNKEHALKRGGGATTVTLDSDSDSGAQTDPMDDDLGPDFVVAMREELARLMGQLPDERLKEIACLKLEGYTSGEIAQKLGVVERTVERKLSLIRAHWRPDDEGGEP